MIRKLGSGGNDGDAHLTEHDRNLHAVSRALGSISNLDSGGGP
ncbi:hypothetical protein AB0362_07065 [Rhodococcus sp. NPDC079359]